MKTPKRKHPSDEMSSLAGRILAGGDYTPDEVRQLAAAVLSHDVTPGPNEPSEQET
jgi:hypothetical protein